MRNVAGIAIAWAVGGCFSDPAADGSGDSSEASTGTPSGATSEPGGPTTDATSGTTAVDTTAADDTTTGAPGGPVLQRVSLSTNVAIEPIADIPVLLRLDTDVFDYAAALPDGADLRIFAEDQRTQLPYEVEFWNPTGVTFVWVRLPDVEAGADTVIFLAYGDPTLPLPPPSTQVWSAGYEAVWHLPALTDSTGNGHDLVATQMPKTVVGVVGDAVNFEAGDDPLTADDMATALSFGSIATIEAWVSTQTNAPLGGGQHRVAVDHWPNYRLVSLSGSGMSFPQLLSQADAMTQFVAVPSPLVVDEWTRLEGSVDTTTGTNNMDWCLRTSLGMSNCNGIPTSAPDASPSPVQIGDPDLLAYVDEVRFSTVRRSVSWGAVQDRSVLVPDFATFDAPGS